VERKCCKYRTVRGEKERMKKDWVRKFSDHNSALEMSRIDPCAAQYQRQLIGEILPCAGTA
jgi:hypothetical protein